jgi:hypothetical protein
MKTEVKQGFYLIINFCKRMQIVLIYINSLQLIITVLINNLLNAVSLLFDTQKLNKTYY